MKDTLIIEPLSDAPRKNPRRKWLLNSAAKLGSIFALSLIFLSIGIASSNTASANPFDDLGNNLIDNTICTQQGVTDGVPNQDFGAYTSNGRLTDSPDVSGLTEEWIGDGTSANPGQDQLSARQYANGAGGTLTYFAKYRDGTDLPTTFDENDDKADRVETRIGNTKVPMLEDQSATSYGLQVNNGDPYNGCTSTISGTTISTLASNLNLRMAASVTGFSGWMLDFALTPTTLTDPLLGAIDSAITGPGGLREVLYMPFLSVIGVLIGIWAFKTAVKEKGGASTLVSGAGWVIIAIVLGAIFMAKPVMIPNLFQTIVSEFASTALTVVSSSTDPETYTGGINSASNPQEDQVSGNQVIRPDGTLDVTAVPESGVTSNTQYENACASSIEDSSENSIEVIKCSLWFNFVFEGWSIAQFGSPSSVVDNTYDSINKGTYTVLPTKVPQRFGPDVAVPVDSFALYAFMSSYPRDVSWGNNRTAASASARLAEITDTLNSAAILDNTAGTEGTAVTELSTNWNGDNPGGRFLSSSLSLLIAILGSSFIFSASLTILLNMMLVLFLTLLTPVIFLFGIHPSGQSIVLQWANKLVATLLKSISQIVIIVIAVTMFKIILLSNMSYPIKTLTVILLTIVLFFYKNEIVETIVPKNDIIKYNGNSGKNVFLTNALNKADVMTGNVEGGGEKLRKGLSIAATAGLAGAAGGAWASRSTIMDKGINTRETFKQVAKKTSAGAVASAKSGYKDGSSSGGVTKALGERAKAKGTAVQGQVASKPKEAIQNRRARKEESALSLEERSRLEAAQVAKDNKLRHEYDSLDTASGSSFVSNYQGDISSIEYDMKETEGSKYRVVNHEGKKILSQLDMNPETGQVEENMVFDLSKETKKGISENTLKSIKSSSEEMERYKKAVAQSANETGEVAQRAHQRAKQELVKAERNLADAMKNARSEYRENERKTLNEIMKETELEATQQQQRPLQVEDQSTRPASVNPILDAKRPNISRPTPKKGPFN